MSDVVAWYRAHAWALIPTLYAVMSLVTFVAYALDKRAARGGAWYRMSGALRARHVRCCKNLHVSDF